ncbi:hypothetical protein LINGRAHAP2_LOCUS25808 [Linum grandiflorum]
MKSLSSVGLGLSIVFGLLLLALVAELYYLLWWKRRFTNRREISDDLSSTSPAKELFYMFCLKKPSSSSSHSQELCSSVRITDALVNHDQFVFKPFGTDDAADAMEAEIIRLNSSSLSGTGPPRFLFTIVEETREDLESEEARSRSRGRSLSDLLLTVDSTPYLTPLTSPPFFTPPLTPLQDSSSHHLLETSTEAEFNKIRSSPPPRFKFLQDADEKLYRKRRLMMGGEVDDIEGKFQIMKRVSKNQELMAGQEQDEELKDGSFITITVDKYIESSSSSKTRTSGGPW